MSEFLFWGLVTFNSLQAADIISTERALRRPGVHEANPIMRGTTRRIAIKAAGAVTVTLLQRKLGTSHPKIAAVTTWGLNGVYGGIVIHNVGVGR
jgi:hypothetical protein